MRTQKIFINHTLILQKHLYFWLLRDIWHWFNRLCGCTDDEKKQDVNVVEVQGDDSQNQSSWQTGKPSFKGLVLGQSLEGDGACPSVHMLLL